MVINRRIVIVSRPPQVPTEDNFKLDSSNNELDISGDSLKEVIINNEIMITIKIIINSNIICNFTKKTINY